MLSSPQSPMRPLPCGAAPNLAGMPHQVIGDLGDSGLVERTIKSAGVEVVLHFAAIAFVGESVADPTRYWQNITSNTLHLLRAMRRAGVAKLIYSSTCATYGSARHRPFLRHSHGSGRIIVVAHTRMKYAARKHE